MSILSAQGEIREAFGRQWVWPKSDVAAWLMPQRDYPALAAAIRAHVNEPKVVLQAGGCCGMYPWLLSDLFERVYTFELDAVNFAFLMANASTGNIIAANAALGDKRGLVGVGVPDPTNSGSYHVVDGPFIPSFMVDDLQLPRLDALMLDTEGYETKVINGAQETISRCRPGLITVETISDEMVDNLAGHGYELKAERAGNDRCFVRTINTSREEEAA